jgi:hypothetical protein
LASGDGEEKNQKKETGAKFYRRRSEFEIQGQQKDHEGSNRSTAIRRRKTCKCKCNFEFESFAYMNQPSQPTNQPTKHTGICCETLGSEWSGAQGAFSNEIQAEEGDGYRDRSSRLRHLGKPQIDGSMDRSIHASSGGDHQTD